jgi:hypothetical protein
MVDQIFVHSVHSNCEDDASRFLINIKALKKVQEQQRSEEREEEEEVSPLEEDAANGEGDRHEERVGGDQEEDRCYVQDEEFEDLRCIATPDPPPNEL